MEFEWDETKNKSNFEKNGIDFNDAEEVFNDKKKKITPDTRKEYEEERMKIIGKIYETIISVIYTLRNSVIRIISARKQVKMSEMNIINK